MAKSTSPRRGRPPSVDHDAILNATYELLREKGVARMTTKDIAERAGVAEGSIFYHYKDRGGLLIAVYMKALESMTEFRRRVAKPSGDLRTTLSDFMTTLEGYLGRALTVLYNAQADVALHAALTAHLQANDIGPHHGLDLVGNYLGTLQAEGRLRPDIDPRTVAFLLLSACTTRVSQPQLMGHHRGILDLDTVLDTVVALIEPQAAR